MEQRSIRHGAAWRRLAAALIDAAVVGLVVMAAGVQSPASGPGVSSTTLVLGAALATFYRVLFEGSPLAATPGKLAFGLRVVFHGGDRLPFATAALRAWPWWLTGAIAGVAPAVAPAAAVLSLLAVAVIPFSATRRGLHDRMAGTRVEDRREQSHESHARETDVEE